MICKKNMKNRILVVDDDAGVGDSLKRVLEETGYTVVLAADGQEGVSRLSQQEFDLLLLDLNLPKISGFDILDLVTEHYPSVAVIILTGLLDQCEPGALAGADALVEKPPDVDLLLRTMENLLREPAGKRWPKISNGLTGTSTIPLPGARHPCVPEPMTRSSGHTHPI